MNVFVCGGKKTFCGCGALAIDTCAFPLRGKKAGEMCERPTCAKCLNGTTMCASHQRYTRAQALRG